MTMVLNDESNNNQTTPATDSSPLSSLTSTSTVAGTINSNNNNNNLTNHNNSRRKPPASRLNFSLTNGRLSSPTSNLQSSSSSSTLSNPGLIRLFCVRHGERIDFAIGQSWPEQAFDKAGNYRRLNLNMPMTLPKRRNPWRDFIGDSPITEIGISQARLTGEALAQNDATIQYCYTSPALRCIQTAHYILEGMGVEDRVKLRVEPGLFEFLGWYERGLPAFLTTNDLIQDEQNLFNLDRNYRPIIPMEKLSRDEKYTDYYNRSFKITQQITDKHKLTGANILFVGHAATLEVCTRHLCGQQPRTYQEFNSVIRKVSYLGLNLCERNPSDGQWQLKQPPVPPLQHSNNILFDWQTMKS